MKNLKRTISLLLTLTLTVLCLGGCNSNTTVSEYSVWVDDVVTSKGDKVSSSDSSAQGNQTTVDRVTSTGSKTETAVNVDKNSLNGKALTVFYPGSSAPQFIKDAISKYEKTYNCKVTYLPSSWNSRANDLANYVNAGKSPDAVIGMVAEDFPLYATSGLLETIDLKAFDINNDKIDTATTKDVFTWDGKTYAIGAFYETEVIIYNKTLIEDAGYKTPLQLYNEGKWTWDEFRKLAKNMSYDNDGDGTNDVYGFTVGVCTVSIPQTIHGY